MIPNAELVRKWGEYTDDGWVRIPASCWPELLWVLEMAEKSEGIIGAAKAFVEAEDALRDAVYLAEGT
jgi:hypothetical protein